MAAAKTKAKGKPAKPKAKAKKMRRLKYWLAKCDVDGSRTVRVKKRRDAFAAWKSDKDAFDKPVKVELEYENPLALVGMCFSGDLLDAEARSFA